MQYFLAKTEPDTYSIDHFAKDKTAPWDGVRNPQAVKFLKQMQKGDMVLIYHTGGEKSIVGLGKVAGNSRPDPKDERSWLVDFTFVKKFSPPFVTLQEIKQIGRFHDFRLVRQSRLSVMPVPEDVIHWLKKEKALPL